MGLIYMRTSPSGGRYIGQTIFTEEERWDQHCKRAFNPKTADYNYIIGKAIRKYGPDNFTCNILENNLPDEKLDEREIYWIDYYKTYCLDGHHGYNMTRGGRGLRTINTKQVVDLWYQGFLVKEIGIKLGASSPTVRVHLNAAGITSEEIKQRAHIVISQKVCEQSMNLRKNDYELVSQLWDSGYSVTEIEQELKRSYVYVANVLTEIGITPEMRQKRKNERLQAGANVIRKNYYNDIIQLWNEGYSSIEIRKKLNISKSCVTNNLNKANIPEEERKKRTRNCQAKPIYQYDLNNNFIREWPSANKAANELRISVSHIREVCLGKAKTCGGFIWRDKNLTT